MKKFLVSVLMNTIGAMTPGLKEALQSWVKEFRESAAKTPNPIDDVIADALCFLLGVKNDDD